MPLSKFDVLPILEPFLKRLKLCVDNGFRDFTTQHAESLHLMRAATKANLTFDHIIFHLRNEFDGDRAAAVVDSHSMTYLRLPKGIAVRIKKFDEAKHSSNYPTNQSKQLKAQDELEGCDVETWLECGYILNEAGTAIAEVHITFSVNDRVVWSVQLDDSEGGIVEDLPLLPHRDDDQPRRVRGKGTKKTKKTDGKGHEPK